MTQDTNLQPILVGGTGDYRMRFNNIVYTYPGNPLLSSGFVKLALSWDNDAGVLRRSANGNYAETTGLTHTLNTAQLVWNTTSLLFGSVHIKSLVFLRKALTQAELIKITAP